MLRIADVERADLAEKLFDGTMAPLPRSQHPPRHPPRDGRVSAFGRSPPCRAVHLGAPAGLLGLWNCAHKPHTVPNHPSGKLFMKRSIAQYAVTIVTNFAVIRS